MPKPLKVLQASAGSGKTFSLTAHYLTLLFKSKTAYREILAVTFTNKATEEMKTRILDVLAGLARGEDRYDNVRQIILAAHPFLNTGLLQAQAKEHYQNILHDFGSFSVNTIDGFVQKVIRGFAFELGLDPGYGLEMNTDKVIEDVASRLNERIDSSPALLKWIINLASDRIEEGKSWNYHDDLIKLAGEIFKERFQPFDLALQILLLDKDSDTLFEDYTARTRACLKDFEAGLKPLVARAAEIFAGTSDRILNKMSGSGLTILDKIDKDAPDHKMVERLIPYIDNKEIWFKKDNPTDLYDRLNPAIKELLGFYSAGLPAYTLAKAMIGKIYYLRLMQEMTGLLKEYRKESGSLLISDAPLLLQGIAGSDSGNPSFIWEKMGNRYTNFLFDEFQDTSVSQWTSFRPLLENALATATGKHTDHLIVGDVKQAIYRWRNGDWNILHSGIRNAIGEASIVEDQLDSNYRSTERIIDFNNKLFDLAPRALQARLNDFVEKNADAGTLEWWKSLQYNELITNVYSQARQKPHAGTVRGGSVSFKILRCDEEENSDDKLTVGAYSKLAMVHTVTEIRRLIAEKQYGYHDICVLVTKNAEAALVVQALMEAGIPVISGDALKIAGNIAVRLLLNSLKAFTSVSAESAISKASCISLYAAIRQVPMDPNRLFGLDKTSLSELEEVLPLSLCRNWQRWLYLPLAELIEKLIGAYGLNEPVHKEHLAYLFAFRDLVTGFTVNGESGLTGFLEWWKEEGESRCLPSAESTRAVQVFTVHKSKGLAFRGVLVPFCNWSLDGKSGNVFWVPAAGSIYEEFDSIPVSYTKSLARSSMARAYFEELLFNYMDAINKLYVAATRTKEHLYFITQGAKPGKEEKDEFSTIGQLLGRIIHQFPDYAPFFTDEDNLIIEEAVVESTVSKPAGEDKTSLLFMQEYPLSDRLGEVLSAEAVNTRLDKLSRNVSLREGSILHEILSRASGTGELDAVLQKMRTEGFLKEAEISHFRHRASLVLNHPDLIRLLETGGEVLNEKTIISATGKSYRPDKVLVGRDAVTILDYKFTLNEDAAHIRQVKGYEELLLEMGYERVHTYLFYALSGKLKEV